MEKIIITHGAKAHIDEVIACGLLAFINKGDITVERSNGPFTEDQKKYTDYFVDVGMQYDGIKYFDHHQPEISGECAATLVAKAFVPELLEDSLWSKILQRVNVVDNTGLSPILKNIQGDEPQEQLQSLLGFEWSLVALFEEAPTIVARTVGLIIKKRLKHIKMLKKVKEWIAENSIVEEVELMFKNINILNITKPCPFDTAAFTEGQQEIIRQNKIDAVYFFDPRDPENRSLFRTRRAEDLLDFNLSTPKTKVFCHKNGFLLTFKAETDVEFKELLRQAKK